MMLASTELQATSDPAQNSTSLAAGSDSLGIILAGALSSSFFLVGITAAVILVVTLTMLARRRKRFNVQKQVSSKWHGTS